MNKSTKIIFVFVLCLSASILNGYFFNYINDQYVHYPDTDNGLGKFSAIQKFFMVVLVAPLIEAALLNLLPNIILTKLKITNEYILVLIPSIVFGLWHYYHLIYIVATFILGILWNGYYVYSKKRGWCAYWLVALVHAVYNLYFLFVV
jgi:ABC-type phosphate transport system permease subunit